LSGDLVADLRAAWQRVAEAVDSGAGTELLRRWAELSGSLHRA
jgi:anthranilate phosphoribosyltransferase